MASWSVESNQRRFDGRKIEGDTWDVAARVLDVLKEAGFRAKDIRIEDYTDQVHVFIRYRDHKWRKVMNIVFSWETEAEYAKMPEL